ncbi:MAG TPA: hypothetical protein VFN35_36030 [Ktedonobacteraceae bacterium]|nr:hypothetical protein [Ktedonobacteraceae bacterium]
MFILNITASAALNDNGMRPLLFILLVLAILLLLTGAIIAIFALRNQQKNGSDGVHLEQLENDII